MRLTNEERQTLEDVIKQLKGNSQKVRRAKVLRQADADGPDWTDQKIAEAYHCRTKTVENIRQRFVKEGFQKTLDRKQRTTSSVESGDEEAVSRQKKYIVRLTAEERQILDEVIKQLKEGSQKVRRAQILRQADEDGPHWVDQQIAETYHCRIQTVENIRRRFVQKGFQKTLDRKQRATSAATQLGDNIKEACLTRKKYRVRLTDEERQILEEVIKQLKGGSQKVRRAQILRQADEGGAHWSDQQIAEAYHCRIQTVEKIRRRFVEEGFQQVLDGKQRATPAVAKLLNGEQEARIIATRLGSPPAGYANWSLRLLAGRVVELGIVEHISPETVRKTLKKTV